ncbi:MarR family transcriptional regulator [Listeria fleischmannii]|uniref:MarR family transcriptional regulator n=1 Tax=Listeria fleischmannii TaxID=1069827 RepID=UPI000DFBE1A7|nr:helix-turn-helix domain-containing protein [Listeria fleischmannii]STY33676.1 Pleiotropic transcriptional repressor [Listeria fleischmannii subsp. coloradonensis]
MRKMGSIRRFNRFYSSILGRIDQKIYHDPYPLTEVRVLQEIDFENGKTASEIGDKLGIDRGYMSRIIKKFDSAGLIEKNSFLVISAILLFLLQKKEKKKLKNLLLLRMRH